MTVVQLEKRIAKLENQIRDLVAEQRYISAIDGIKQGMRQMKRGMGMTIDDAFAKIRASAKPARKRRS